MKGGTTKISKNDEIDWDQGNDEDMIPNIVLRSPGRSVRPGIAAYWWVGLVRLQGNSVRMCRTAADELCHMLRSRGDGSRSVGESYGRSRSVVRV